MTKSQVLRPDGSIKSLVIHKYDALERRISKEANGVLTRYAYDNEDIIIEFGSNDTIKAVYLHGPEIDEPIAMARDVNEDGRFDKKEVFFYSKDHLNSIHDLTDFEGKPVQRYNYSAYGKTKIEKTNPDLNAKLVKNPYSYTSREWDQETGDYYYRARFYDPRSGRFLSEDPIGFSSKDFNFYRYTLNNPVLLSDPRGKDAWLDKMTCWILKKSNPDLECGDWTDNFKDSFCKVFPSACDPKDPPSPPEEPKQCIQ